MKRAAIVLACLAMATTAYAREPLQSTRNAVAIDRVTPLYLSPGQEVVMRGSWRTSFDGTVLDAATRTDVVSGSKVVRLDGWIDASAGGLSLVEADPELHTARFVVTGNSAACSALGVSACLVPRTATLAHERLLSVDEFVKTLSGGMDMEIKAAPEPAMTPATKRGWAAFVLLAALVNIGGIAAAIRHARRRTPLGRVRTAASEARAATRGDAMLAPVHAQIGALARRATQLEDARRACARRLAKIDRAGIARRRAEWSTSTAPEASEALAWVHAEQAEAARLEADLGASLAGLERIASALRVITLRARSHRGVRVRVATRTADPVDTVATELALRDEALAEAERI